MHGNFDALQTVLMILIIETSIKFTISGTISELVMKQIKYSIQFDRDDMEIIAGNHDEAVMSLVNNTPYPEDLKDKFYASSMDRELYG